MLLTAFEDDATLCIKGSLNGNCDDGPHPREVRVDSKGAARVSDSQDRRHATRCTWPTCSSGSARPSSRRRKARCTRCLSKMRREGTVDYDWQESDAGPPRKYYKLTTKGKSQLDELSDYWTYINQTLDNLGRG